MITADAQEGVRRRDLPPSFWLVQPWLVQPNRGPRWQPPGGPVAVVRCHILAIV
eukprot:CAMPEP_0202850942 /NCGR_PEP_ID=MMETSP1389-20130828/84956_1 /ASSEMBLY_ACC=CAM_ASM_000865 /TAXON_ID=302021 /ORGANISM="Rhodomonas sp., Strain CCMP768" /LENGTH=53 /DNA_ID=CAMNT_0049529189 /DNA_START=21 /DNA_END=179 /DNA_ORIENTATION=+